MTEYGGFWFNLRPGEDRKYHEITTVEMKNVMTGFRKYNLKDEGQECKATASPTEMEYVLPETVGGTRVHLLLGIKNTRIQPVLIRVLPSGVGVYLSPFRDVWGSRIIFAGPSKIFTQTNRDQQRESNHAVYSLKSRVHLVKSIDCVNKRKVRFDSKLKMKTSFYSEPIKDKIRIECGDKAVEISAHHHVSLPIASAELARVQVNLEIDLVLQGLKFYSVLIVWVLYGVCNVLNPDSLKLGLDNYHLKEGSRIKLHSLII